MTPYEFASAWEDARLGEVLALLMAAVGVALYVVWEWRLSREDREARRVK